MSAIFFAHILVYTLVLIFSIFKTDTNLSPKGLQRMINYSAGFYLIFSSYLSFENNVDTFTYINNNTIIFDLLIAVTYIITHSLSLFFAILLLINILYNLGINFQSFLETKLFKNIYTKFSNFNLSSLIMGKREWYYESESYKTNGHAKTLFGIIYFLWLFLEVIYELLHELIGGIIKFILYLIGFLLASLYSMHDINLQNVIYIIARLSVIYSISVTFFIFNYYEVISRSGLSFFEFIATIFLLPLIFNEIKDFRERSNNMKVKEVNSNKGEEGDSEGEQGER